jgi:MFS family permease
MLFQRAQERAGRLDRVVKLHLACKFFGALYFVYPIFYEFASQTITPIEVGVFFSLAALCNFIADIPTGILADKHSRKASALVGVALLTIAPLIVLLADSFLLYGLAAVFYGVGGACMNGAIEALVYDHKNVSKTVFRRVNALEMTFGQAGILVSAALGGFMFATDQTVPFAAQIVAGLIWLVLVAFIQEQNKDGHLKPTASHGQYFAQSMKHLLATPYLRVVVFMGVVFSVMLGMCIQLVNEAAMIEHGLQAAARGLIISGAGLATIIVLNLFLLKVFKSDAARILYMAFGAMAAYWLMGLGGLPLFLAGYVLWCCLNTTSSFIRLIIHDRVPGSHRSTILSSFKTLAVLIGLGASTGTGLLVQWAHTPRAAYIVFGLISIVVLVPCAVWLVTYGKEIA